MKKYISERLLTEQDEMSENEIENRINDNKSAFYNDVLSTHQYMSNISSLYSKLRKKCKDRDTDIEEYNCKKSVYDNEISDISITSSKCDQENDPNKCREDVSEKIYKIREEKDDLEYPTEE